MRQLQEYFNTSKNLKYTANLQTACATMLMDPIKFKNVKGLQLHIFNTKKVIVILILILMLFSKCDVKDKTMHPSCFYQVSLCKKWSEQFSNWCHIKFENRPLAGEFYFFRFTNPANVFWFDILNKVILYPSHLSFAYIYISVLVTLALFEKVVFGALNSDFTWTHDQTWAPWGGGWVTTKKPDTSDGNCLHVMTASHCQHKSHLCIGKQVHSAWQPGTLSCSK